MTVADLTRKQNRWALWALLPAAAVVALAAILGIGYVVTPDPLTYGNLPFPVASPVRAGDILAVTVQRCNNENRPLAYTFVRDLVNTRSGARYTLPGGAAFVNPGCATVESHLNGVPADLPTGDYQIEGITHATGTWRSVTLHWRTAVFHVIAQGEPGQTVTPPPTPEPFPTPLPGTPTPPGSGPGTGTPRPSPVTGPSGPPGPPGPTGPPGPPGSPPATPRPTPTPTPILPLPSPSLPCLIGCGR